jgi:hypothetical protein
VKSFSRLRQREEEEDDVLVICGGEAVRDGNLLFLEDLLVGADSFLGSLAACFHSL